MSCTSGCQDRGVEMPESDDTQKQEILRTLMDFRHEFREALSKMVRSDVYLADLRTIDVRLMEVTRDNQRLADQLKDERNDRRSLRNITLAAFGSAVIAIITALVK